VKKVSFSTIMTHQSEPICHTLRTLPFEQDLTEKSFEGVMSKPRTGGLD
jgi:hypothetical protein